MFGSNILEVAIGLIFIFLLYSLLASAINEAIAKLKENNPYSTLELLKGSVFSIVFSSIFGLILAAFFKSKSTQE